MVVASVQISESNTVGETVTDDVTNINFGSDDSVNIVPATHPITAGTNSYEKYIRIKLVLSNDSTQIDNFQAWMTGSDDGAEIDYYSNLNTTPYNDTFATPVATASTKADTVWTGNWDSDPAAQNLFVSGATTALTSDATYTDYAVFQLRSTASQGAGSLNQKTLHFEYDEQ